MKDIKSNYRIDDVIDYLLNQDGARKLLSKLGIQVTQKDFEVSEFERNFEYRKIILKDGAMVNGAPVDVAIDVKLGQPTTDQVCELMYGYGRDCGIRIILFNDYGIVSDHDNIGADEIVVESLVNAMNQYPVGLYLIKIHREDSDACWSTFEIIKSAEDEPQYGIDELLTVEKFKEAEFWYLYYDGVDNPYRDTLDVFSVGIRNSDQFGNMIESVNCETHLVWNNEGVTFSSIVPFKYLNAATNIFLGDNGNPVDLYWDFEKSITITPERNVKITIKTWDFPLSRLYVSENLEKKGYAILIRTGFWKFHCIIEDLFENK